MPKITVTQETLNQYPQLVDLGIVVGQEIDSEEYDLPLGDDENLGDDPPPDPGTGGDRPRKPPIRP